MVNSNRRILTEELLKVQVDAVDTTYIQDELSTMQVAISQIIETLSLSNLDEQRMAIIDQLIQVCNNVLDQIIMNMNLEVQRM